MFKCLFLKRKLFDYATGFLETEKSQSIEKHIEQCSKCQKYVKDVQVITSTASSDDKPFFGEVFWRKFDERLELRLSDEQGVSATDRPWYFKLKPARVFMPRFAFASAIAVCLILLILATPLKNYFKNISEDELYEMAMIMEDTGELGLNHDEDAYIEEYLIQLEFEDV